MITRMVSMLGIIPLQTVSPMVNMMSNTLRRMLAQNQAIGGPVTVTLDHVPYTIYLKMLIFNTPYHFSSWRYLIHLQS